MAVLTDCFDRLMASGRTDGKPHAEFDYDPRNGIELPPCKSRLLKLMSRNRFRFIRVISAEIRCRIFRRTLMRTFRELIAKMEL